MLKHRLIAGTILAAAMGGVLLLDTYFAPYFPALLACTLLAGLLAIRELVLLFPEPGRPSLTLCWLGTISVLLCNWLPIWVHTDPWRGQTYAFIACILISILWEMYHFREPGDCITRISRAVLCVGYLGLLPSFFIRQRWDLPANVTTVALTLTIFVPKCCDIGAYFTGRLIGKHRMTPLLSPKKTWEGFAGGLLAAVGVSVGLSYAADIFRYGFVEAVGFGLALGLAGVLGDLGESLIKRDCLAKDASTTIPGFGGVLDVIDSILFAGPVAYWWLTR